MQPIQSFTKFQVLGAKVSYHALLKRPLVNKHKLVILIHEGAPSMKLIKIATNPTLFKHLKTLYVDVGFHEEFIVAQESRIKQQETPPPP